ncbi:MAG: T9SS C-terminal target domain-containing protein, partial [Sphingobacteriales bacterium]
ILYTTGSQANVNFVNASTNPAVANFRLQANSPAVNAGNNSFASATDILGVTRPSGGTVDMGCYEYVGATADTQAPTVPASLISASITQTSFTLNWAASTDASGINRYEIFRNGTSIGTSTTTSFNVTGLAANTSYSMSVSAFDNATPNNVSNQSAPLSVRTLQAPVSGNLGFESDFTSWVTYGSASITTTAANVRSGAKAGFFSNGGGNYTFTGLTPGATYSLRGWIKAASGTEIWITASNYGGANTGLSSSATSWTQTGNIIFTMGASNTTVTLATWTGATSSAYFDDFTVAPYTTPPAVATNIATSGDASIWSDIPSATSTSNATKSANTLINNGNTTAEVVYNDVNSAGNWQAAGIVWATAQKSITSIKLYHGEHLGGNDNGCFTANMKVQKTNDGTTWTDVSGWAVSPTYPYTAATSNQTYTLTGPKIVDARGVRIVGQVRTNDISWSIKVRELEVLGSATASLSAPSNSILKVARQEKSTVAVYPNPASNSFNVSAQSDNAKITISTLHGKVITIVNANAKVTTIDSGNWAAGMYLIQVQTGAQTTVKKVIIAK